MGRSRCFFQVFGCLVLALFLATAGPVQAETIVNNADVGTKASPFEGDGIAAGDVIPDTDDYNEITNNADIYVKYLSDTAGERGYGIYNYNGIVTNYGTIYSLDNHAVKFGPYDPLFSGTGPELDDILYNYGTIITESESAVATGRGNDRIENYGTIRVGDADIRAGIAMAQGNDTLINYESGRIIIEACDAGISFASGNDTFKNYGTYTVESGNALAAFAHGSDRLVNSGTMSIEYSNYAGISFASGNDILTNSGTIDIEYAMYEGISFAQGDDSLENSGTINIGRANNFSGITFGSGADTLTNSGTISIGWANRAGITFAQGDDSLENSGTIDIHFANCYAGISFASGNDTLINSGTIIVEEANCSGISMAEGDDTLTNTSSATIRIGHVGGAGISLGQGNDTLTNSGMIDIGVAEGYPAIMFCDGDDRLENSGTINILYTCCTGIDMSTGDDTFINSGTITIGTSNYAGIHLGDGENYFENSGTISILYAAAVGINIGSGVHDGTFINSGNINIVQACNAGIHMGSESGDDYFENSGTIDIGTTYGTAIKMRAGADTLDNSGVINVEYAGNMGICMSSGDDTLNNSGTINIGTALCHGINLGTADATDTLENSGTINIEYANCSGINFETGDDTLENSGTINIGFSGNGGIFMGSGDDTLTNTGIIVGSILMDYGDDTVTLGSTESGSTNTGDIDGDNDTDAGTADTLNLVGAGTVTGDICNFETLTKTGAGVFSLNGDVGVENTATISGGTLLIDGDMAHHTAGPLAVLIEAAGTLGQNGTITGNVTNNGTLAAGTSIGMLTIDGDYENNGTIAIEVDRTSADRIDVVDVTGTGTATLNDATEATVTPIGVTMDGDTHTVLTAVTLTGDGVPDGDVVQTSPVLSFEFNSYMDSTPHAITMTTHRTPYMDLVSGSNQRSIAANLFASLGDASGDWEQFLVLLDTLPTTDALGDALDEISPEPYANFGDMSRASINLYMKAIRDRLGGLRDMAELSSAQQYASNILTGSGPVLADVPAPEAETLSVWASGFGQWAEQDGESGNLGFEYESSGVALGVDKVLTDTITVGLSGGFANNDVEFDEVSAETDIDTWHVGVYGTYTADLFYVDASVSYADNEYDSERDISLVGLTAESDHDGRDYSVYVGGGYNMSLGGFKVIPTASVQYIDHKEDSFTETGAGILNLEVDDIDSESIVGAIGVRVARMFEVGGATLLPEVSARWAHEFGDTEDTVKARFAGSTAGTFSVDSIDTDADSALLGASVTAYLTDSFSLFLGYDAELRSGFDAHNVSGGLKYSF